MENLYRVRFDMLGSERFLGNDIANVNMNRKGKPNYTPFASSKFVSFFTAGLSDEESDGNGSDSEEENGTRHVRLPQVFRNINITLFTNTCCKYFSHNSLCCRAKPFRFQSERV